MADFRIVKKTKCRTKYKGIGVDTLQHIKWQPKIYNDPFKFDFDVVKVCIFTVPVVGWQGSLGRKFG